MRTLRDDEIDELLAADLVARLATIDGAGYPRVTPMWFLWHDGKVHLTSYADRPHLKRIRANPRVGLVIDTEDAQREDGERPNRQIRMTGDACVVDDPDGVWTRRIERKYVDARISPGSVDRTRGGARALIIVRPHGILAVASV